MSQPTQTSSSEPSEDVVRGILFALPILPAGIIASVALWSIGFIASIVAFGVAYGALWLYRLGTGGRLRAGAPWLIGLIALTVVLSFFACNFWDLSLGYSAQQGTNVFSEIVNPDVWALWWNGITTDSQMWQAIWPDLVFDLLFGALGCWSIVRSLVLARRAEQGGPAA